MDDYILYEEINSSPAKVVFKARKRKSVLYVGIHRFDTALKDYATVNVHSLHSLKHRNVLQFMEWYQSSNHVWVVTELVNGGTLADIMDQDGPMNGGNSCSIVRDIAAGLNYVHSQGIIVCDLVPSKILVDCNGDLKLSDFSICWKPGTGVTRWSMADIKKSFELMESKITEIKEDNGNDTVVLARHLTLETLPVPFYMAPEVVTDANFSDQSDLWSMGCILFELMTGSPPFHGNTTEYQEIANTVTRLSQATVTDDQHMQGLLDGLLQPNREDRLTWSSSELQLLLSQTG